MEYRFYTDDEAQVLCDLMVRNKYWEWDWGKMKSLTPDELARYHRENGFAYGVIGMDQDKAVAYLEANTNNYQCPSNERQIVFTGYLVDTAYRNSVVSIYKLFEIMMLKAIELGYQEVLSTVNIKKKEAFNIYRKMGGVRLDDKYIYGQSVVQHNYLPALYHLMRSDSISVSTRQIIIPYADKRDPFKPVTYYDKDIIRYRFLHRTDKCFVDVLIDINESRAVGIDIHTKYFCIVSKDGTCVEFKPYSEKYGDVGTVSRHYFGNENVVTLCPDGDEYSLNFYRPGFLPGVGTL